MPMVMRPERYCSEKTDHPTRGTRYKSILLQRIREMLSRLKAYLFRQMIRADVDGCDAFDSFARVVDVEAEGLGGIAFSEGSAPFWTLLFFFAIAENVFRSMKTCSQARSNGDVLLA